MAKKENKNDGLSPLARRKKEALGEGKARTIGAPSVMNDQPSKPPRKRATKKKR